MASYYGMAERQSLFLVLASKVQVDSSVALVPFDADKDSINQPFLYMDGNECCCRL